MNIDVTKNPLREQIDMLSKATGFPLNADAEYPEFSETELMQFEKTTSSHKAEIVVANAAKIAFANLRAGF